MSRSKARERARKKRLFAGAAAAVVAAAASITVIYWNLPETKVGRRLDKAAEHMMNMEYVEAEEAFAEALSIDEGNVVAYRGLADDYQAQGRTKDAENILIEGYEKTGEEVLLQNYAATILNAAVEEINAGTADLDTIGRILDVLDEDSDNDTAVSLLATCASRVLYQEKSAAVLLDGLDGSSNFEQYLALANRVLTLAEQDAETYRGLVPVFSLTDGNEVLLSLSHGDDYREVLTRAEKLGDEAAAQLLLCLDKQAEISAYFAPMFAEFEAKNYKAAKDFIVTEEYQAIRDAFIDDTMELWNGMTYIPVTKEAIRFMKGENGWEFAFLDNDQLAAPTGTIRILGQKMKDLGVQRTAIEYVPAYDSANYYPHTEYEIVYWNTMVSGIATDNTNVVSRMNYRFAEKIYTQDGMEANMIYDWGGSNETRKKE